METITGIVKDIVLTLTGLAVAIVTIHKEVRESRKDPPKPPAEPE